MEEVAHRGGFYKEMAVINESPESEGDSIEDESSKDDDTYVVTKGRGQAIQHSNSNGKSLCCILECNKTGNRLYTSLRNTYEVKEHSSGRVCEGHYRADLRIFKRKSPSASGEVEDDGVDMPASKRVKVDSYQNTTKRPKRTRASRRTSSSVQNLVDNNDDDDEYVPKKLAAKKKSPPKPKRKPKRVNQPLVQEEEVEEEDDAAEDLERDNTSILDMDHDAIHKMFRFDRFCDTVLEWEYGQVAEDEI